MLFVRSYRILWGGFVGFYRHMKSTENENGYRCDIM